MKDKLKITYAEDGHKVVTHSKPIGRKKLAGATRMVKRERRTNYWQRHASMLNMPVAFYILINVILLFLVISAFFAL